MARDIDDLPLYDNLIRPRTLTLSDVWFDSFSSLILTLQEYLSQSGIFTPQLTTEQRDALISPVEGQIIYLTDAIAGPPRTAELQVWLVTAGVGSWVTIV